MNRRAALYRALAAIATGLVASLIDVFPESVPPVRPVPNPIEFQMDRLWLVDFNDARAMEQILRETSQVTGARYMLIGVPTEREHPMYWHLAS